MEDVPDTAWTYRAESLTPSRVRRDVLAWARGYDSDPDLLGDIALAVTEAATNAVLHAYLGHAAPGPIVVEGERGPGHLCIHVRDTGSGLAARVDSPGLGLGLGLIAQVSDSTDVRTPETGGTEVVMRFNLGRSMRAPAGVAVGAS
jgi:serine/threonine-protein kinase RsbW